MFASRISGIALASTLLALSGAASPAAANGMEFLGIAWGGPTMLHELPAPPPKIAQKPQQGPKAPGSGPNLMLSSADGRHIKAQPRVQNFVAPDPTAASRSGPRRLTAR